MKTIDGCSSADYLRAIAANGRVLERERLSVLAVADEMEAMDAEIAALKAEVEHLRSVFSEIGRCPECGDEPDGCYCADDAADTAEKED